MRTSLHLGTLAGQEVTLEAFNLHVKKGGIDFTSRGDPDVSIFEWDHDPDELTLEVILAPQEIVQHLLGLVQISQLTLLVNGQHLYPPKEGSLTNLD